MCRATTYILRNISGVLLVLPLHFQSMILPYTRINETGGFKLNTNERALSKSFHFLPKSSKH